MEVEARGATVLFRALPLCPGGEPAGALVLVGDVTELRRRDRQLLSKDATIREIHHRVKNNLQTVAALLRLQARRVESPAARTALAESVRRVASIAMVHETLAVSLDERVDFDGIVDRLLGSLGDVAGAGTRVRLQSAGLLRGAGRRRGHPARDGAHRGGAERGRARLPGLPDGPGHGVRPPVQPSRRGGGRRRRGRAGAGLRAGRQRPARAADRPHPGAVRAARHDRRAAAPVGTRHRGGRSTCRSPAAAEPRPAGKPSGPVGLRTTGPLAKRWAASRCVPWPRGLHAA